MKRENANLWRYLGWIAVFWGFTFVTLNLWLKPYSIAYAQTGTITPGYLAYALIGMVFSTPAPFLSVLIVAVCWEKIGLKAFFTRLVHTERKGKTALLTGGFCLAALIFALLRGKPNGPPWYLLPLGWLVMIPFVGLAEEAGWRGFLQPEMEKRMKFPFSVLTVAAIWDIWHIDQWLDPTANHYGDSFLGFSVQIFIWAFALAALYKATGSVMACAIYHAFVNAIGAIYDWNALFDPFPGDVSTNIYRAIVLIGSVALWIHASKTNTEEGQHGRKESTNRRLSIGRRR